MAFDVELQTYREHLADLLPHAGEYVLIHGVDVVDTYVSYEDALKEGYRQFRLKPFMVKQIQQTGEAAFLSRHFVSPQSF